MSNTFKKSLAILSIALLSSATFIYAADKNSFQPPHQGRMQQRMAQQLSLTADQQPLFNEIMKQQHEKAIAFRKQLQQETDNRLKQILTTEQMDKFNAIKKQHRDKKHHKKQTMQQGKMNY